MSKVHETRTTPSSPPVAAPGASSTGSTPPEGDVGWDDMRMQKLWLAVRSREWNVLAVLSTAKSVDSLAVAELLAQLAWRYQGHPSSVVDLRDLSLRLVDYQLRELEAHVESGSRVLIALRPTSENPTASTVARRADAVVLCVGLGTTHLKGVQQTIAEVGRDRILGTIVVRGATLRPSRPPPPRT